MNKQGIYIIKGNEHTEEFNPNAKKVEELIREIARECQNYDKNRPTITGMKNYYQYSRELLIRLSAKFPLALIVKKELPEPVAKYYKEPHYMESPFRMRDRMLKWHNESVIPLAEEVGK